MWNRHVLPMRKFNQTKHNFPSLLLCILSQKDTQNTIFEELIRKKENVGFKVIYLLVKAGFSLSATVGYFQDKDLTYI